MNRKTSPDVGNRIAQLRKRLKLSQSELGYKLNASSMAVSRWERGMQPPPAQTFLSLGTLAGKSECWFFWGLAGLTSDDVLRILPKPREPSRGEVDEVQLVSAGVKAVAKKSCLVAVPLLPLFAAADTEGGSQHFDFALVEPEGILAAPSLWCPNPSLTSSLRVKGDSMEPLLHDGYIIAVDRKQKDCGKLKNKVIVVFNREYGLVVSRLRRVGKMEMLVPDNRQHQPVPLTHDWKIIGKVLWWIGTAS